MKLELVCEGQTCHEIDKEELANRFSGAIRRFRDRVTWARVKLVDVRDETGAWAKRCVVQMRLRQRPQVVFAVTGARGAAGGRTGGEARAAGT